MRESADKRSRRTQRIIQTTMLELLCTQPMTSIKIVDLCTQADINRTTFYLHFSSIADVLVSLQDEIIRHIFAESEALVDFTKPSDPLPFLNACTGVLGSYKHLGSFLRHGQDADLFLNGLKSRVTETLLSRYIKKGGSAVLGSHSLLLFLTAGVLDVYIAWLKTDQSVPFAVVIGYCAPVVEKGLQLLASNIRRP